MSQLIVEQHGQWHEVYGKYVTCPLDCGSGEIVSETFEADQELLLEEGSRGIRCGSCSGRHARAATVRFCYEVKRDAETFARNKAAMIAAIEAEGECGHGLSAALCEGPNHYPADC